MDCRGYRDGVDVDREAPAGLLFDEHPVMGEHPDQLPHEERIATGGRGESSQQLVGQLCGSEYVGGQFGCRIGIKLR